MPTLQTEDEGYKADHDQALDSDNEDDDEYDSSSDSDGGLVMQRRKSATKQLSTSGGGGSSLAAALAAQAARRKERRGTGLSVRSKGSKKSSRSGSNNTMKKVRTRDSIEERRES